MTDRFLDICAPGVRHLTPYVPGKPTKELERELGIARSIKLASNENPLGPGPLARAALATALDELGRYPDGGAYELRQAIAARHALDPACVTVGNGSNDVLDLVARVFLYPGAEALFSQFAFAVYPISSKAVGASLQIVPALDYGHDAVALADAVNDDTRVIWIANPNNPTGTWLGRDALGALLERVPKRVIVVVDEAYFEYVAKTDYPDASQWLDDYANLIVTRTFSKVHGLAALRIGYGLSHPDVAALLNRVRQPFNVNSLAQAAALAALEDRDHIRRSVEANRAGLHQLEQGFHALGLDFIPSAGNFLTVDLGRPAGPIDQALLRLGVITRPLAGYGLPQHLRVSVGLPEENTHCLAAFAAVLGA